MLMKFNFKVSFLFSLKIVKYVNLKWIELLNQSEARSQFWLYKKHNEQIFVVEEIFAQSQEQLAKDTG